MYHCEKILYNTGLYFYCHFDFKYQYNMQSSNSASQTVLSLAEDYDRQSVCAFAYGFFRGGLEPTCEGAPLSPTSAPLPRHVERWPGYPGRSFPRHQACGQRALAALASSLPTTIVCLLLASPRMREKSAPYNIKKRKFPSTVVKRTEHAKRCFRNHI